MKKEKSTVAKYAEVVAEAFSNKQAKKSPLSLISYPDYQEKGRRLTTDGTDIKSYGWWTVAYWDGDDVWVTDERYHIGGYWKNGNPKYSVTTDMYIREVERFLRIKGYQATEERSGTFVRWIRSS